MAIPQGVKSHWVAVWLLQAMQLKTCGTNLTWKASNKSLEFLKRVEVVGTNKDSSFPSPAARVLSVLVKENPDRKYIWKHICLVYLFSCSKCKMQYVERAIDHFRSKWNNYKSDSRKHVQSGTCMQKYWDNHFWTSGHCGFFEDVSLTIIDKTDSFHPFKRGDYGRKTLKNVAPYGLNIGKKVSTSLPIFWAFVFL